LKVSRAYQTKSIRELEERQGKLNFILERASDKKKVHVTVLQEKQQVMKDHKKVVKDLQKDVSAKERELKEKKITKVKADSLVNQIKADIKSLSRNVADAKNLAIESEKRSQKGDKARTSLKEQKKKVLGKKKKNTEELKDTEQRAQFLKQPAEKRYEQSKAKRKTVRN